MSNFRNTVFKWFETYDKPTESQFRNLFNWIWFKDETIPVEQIEGLDELVREKADAELVTVIKDEVDSLKETASVGLRNDTTIELEAFKPYLYQVPNNCYVFALDIKGNGICSVGTGGDLYDDIAEIDVTTHGILQIGLITNRELVIYAESMMSVTPIIYQYQSGDLELYDPEPT